MIDYVKSVCYNGFNEGGNAMELFTVNELTKIMKVSRTTVYHWVKLGMPYYKTPGGRYRFKVEEVAIWCDNTKQEGE